MVNLVRATVYAVLGLVAVVAQQSHGNKSSSRRALFVGGAAPVVDLGHAKYQGIDDDLTKTSNYLGLRFGRAPRFDHATLFEDALEGIQPAVDFGPACPQRSLASLFAPNDLGLGSLAGLIESTPLLQRVLRVEEDCLFLNVQRPQNPAYRNLPVVVWIHGGGFQVSSKDAFGFETTAIPGLVFQGASIVHRSLDMDRPIVFVGINYRLAALGFSASRELKEAGLLNLGFEDQRLALRWVQKHIAAFGGDPNKVTLMGQSAGAISVSAHLVAGTSDGQGRALFRGAIGISGGLLKLDGPERQQGVFDSLVQFVGCERASDVIACLRDAPYERILQHMETIRQYLLSPSFTELYLHTQALFIGFQSLAVPWALRPDGKLLPQSPHRSQVADVPLLYGNVLDEGTLFSLINQLNITTTAQVKDYFHTYWWHNASSSQLDRLLELYPQDPNKGSPYGTGLLYSIPPQYKRLASIIGDYIFQCQRRDLLGKSSAPKWNYLVEISVIPRTNIGQVPVLGSFHVSDILLHWFGTIPEAVSTNTRNLMSALVSFVHDLDPNNNGGSGVPVWPQWDGRDKKTMRFRESGADIIRDDYRDEGMSYMNEIGDSLLL